MVKVRVNLWVLLLGVVCFVAVVVGAGYFATHRPRNLASQPELGGTLTTAHLLTTVSNLYDSFSRANPSASKSTRNFIANMNDIERECADIKTYARQVKQQDSSPTAQYLQKSDTLCDDLTKVARDIKEINIAILPVMNISNAPKRYQTLGPMRDKTKNDHKKAVHTALAQISFRKPQTDFESDAQTSLRSLETTINGAADLTYYPAVNKFQSQMIAERQRYWVNYGDIVNLKQALSKQLTRYCQSLPNGNQVSVCKQD